MFQKIVKAFAGALVKACVVFTAMNIIVYTAEAFIPGVTGTLTLLRVGYIFAFSLIAGAMTEFLTSGVMNLAVRSVIHYAVILAVFLLFFIFIPGRTDTRSIFTAAAILTVLWAIPFFLWLALRSHREKKEKQDEQYKSAFSK